ncbi:hypothetical protein HF313_12485 [Massilia atriviolacea]|uniref:DUF3142 domain-containing protein n=1 Tax=Massilia atriviolacea TaxID=2495579 RepID=A0A430HGI7_9BURK|nr:hypothetical protein [Massilia atriviolacea]RSZ56612.1 hypothetical protein EJB06_23565 [Massilia atriviolacea]
MQRLLVLLLASLALLTLRMDSSASPVRALHPALAALPAELVWAWERPEDLRWLPADVGVAYVGATVLLQGGQAQVYRRAAPLLLAPGAARVPVLHVDVSWRKPPVLSEAQGRRIADELLRLAAQANRQVVQLDFEVRRSQRPFLARTIGDIRARLDPSIALSVTALASWCLDDYWLHDIAADEVVPMAFRMGQAQHALRARLLQQGGFTRARCGAAIGFATDEAMMAVREGRHYYFSPQAWSAARWQALRDTPRSTIPSRL